MKDFTFEYINVKYDQVLCAQLNLFLRKFFKPDYFYYLFFKSKI